MKALQVIQHGWPSEARQSRDIDVPEPSPGLLHIVSFEGIPAALELHEERNTLGRGAARIRLS